MDQPNPWTTLSQLSVSVITTIVLDVGLLRWQLVARAVRQSKHSAAAFDSRRQSERVYSAVSLFRHSCIH